MIKQQIKRATLFNTDHSGNAPLPHAAEAVTTGVFGQRFRRTARSGAPRRHYQYHVIRFTLLLSQLRFTAVPAPS
jgi:hypothetical protein